VLALLLLLQLTQAPAAASSAPTQATVTRPDASRATGERREASPTPRPATGPGVEGRGAPTVTIPRVEDAVVVDGRLDEPAWAQAARLVGFSQYQPVDSRSSEEQTEVLVWYSPGALHFGIIARDREPGSIRATVADRDNLSRDDTVTVYLDTFNDKRRAFFFTVNPLGMQEDGVRSEGAFNAGTMFGGMTDKNPDYQWDSKGRLTDEGFVVEIRIPFKSLRYPGSGPQRWGINVERKVQRTGYVDTWTDVKRANSSYLAQAGGIDGLHDMKRGVVTEVQPFVTAASDGSARADGSFARESGEINPGVNVRLGLTNVSVDATVNPDFSQVESDAGQVTANQRFALFYPEKRPFFLEGIELFSTPNQLVYTRQIVSPVAGGKVTGKLGRTSVAFLSAKEKESAGSALFNVARVRRDLGTNSTMGVTYTDRTAEGEYNRVLAADSRIVFAKLYYVQGQVGQSWTGVGEPSGAATTQVRTSSPVWLGEFDRTGRAWGFNYKLTGLGTDFVTRSGYVPRSDIVDFHGSNRLSWYGKRGAFVEQFTTFFGPALIWRYADFGHAGAIEGNQSVNLMWSLRGGWSIRTTIERDFVHFDPEAYEDYYVLDSGSLRPFEVPDGLSNLWVRGVTVTTPTYRTFNASVTTKASEVAIFAEASEGDERQVTATIGLRPTPSIRAEASTIYSRITRARDGSEFARTVIPRLKLEYQPNRALFFRLVGEYRSQRQDALLDPWTGEDALVVRGAGAGAQASDGLRLDFLLSYEPTPGTVAFFGYGSSLATARPLSLHEMHRQSDGFFVKLAYLFRR
jgi:hypothetical protein